MCFKFKENIVALFSWDAHNKFEKNEQNMTACFHLSVSYSSHLQFLIIFYKEYIPNIVASRHFIGKDSLTISFAHSISL